MTSYRMKPGTEIFGYNVASLRTEARKGNLVINRIAGKDYVTEAAIREMERRCERRQGQGYGLREGGAGPHSGLSKTERTKLALASAKISTMKLLKSSENTSRTAGQTQVSEACQKSSLQMS